MKNAKNYESINWEHCNIKLFKLQSEILKAYKTGVVADVLKAQYKLTRSFAARSLAVRKVTHKQVEYSKDSNLRAIWRERGIIL